MTLALLFCRVFGFSLFLPLGKGLSDNFVRILFSFVLALALCKSFPVFTHFSIVAIFIELIIGVLIALPFAFSLDVFCNISEFFDLARGMNIAQVYDPSFEGERSVLSMIFRQALWAYFLWQGFMFFLLNVFLKSYQLYSPWKGADFSSFYTLLEKYLVSYLYYFLEILALSFSLSLPFLVLFILVDLFFAFLAKLLPKIQMQSESFLVKSFLGGVLVYSLIKLDYQDAFLQIINSKLGQ